MKMWLAAGACVGQFYLFLSRPTRNEQGNRWLTTEWLALNEARLRELGFTRKVPTGLKILTVHVWVR